MHYKLEYAEVLSMQIHTNWNMQRKCKENKEIQKYAVAVTAPGPPDRHSASAELERVDSSSVLEILSYIKYQTA